MTPALDRSAWLLLVSGACLLGCAAAEDTDLGTSPLDAAAPLDAKGPLDTTTLSDTTTPLDATPPKVDAVADDSRTIDAAPLDSTPPPSEVATARCGDGRIGTGEVCDDGGNVDGDGCSADCSSVECATGRVFEDPATHHCYRRWTEVLSRSSAQAKCAVEGGYLARFATAAERDAAYPTMISGGTDELWIGLTKVASVPTWDDGTAAVATELRWGAGEPSGDGDCIEWKSGNELNDLACSGHSRDFVCEREPKGTM